MSSKSGPDLQEQKAVMGAQRTDRCTATDAQSLTLPPPCAKDTAVGSLHDFSLRPDLQRTQSGCFSDDSDSGDTSSGDSPLYSSATRRPSWSRQSRDVSGGDKRPLEHSNNNSTEGATSEQGSYTNTEAEESFAKKARHMALGDDKITAQDSISSSLSGGSTTSPSEDSSEDVYESGSDVKGGHRVKRDLPSNATKVLKEWLLAPEHIRNPYPTVQDMYKLQEQTGLTKMQLKNWFTNSRRRLWKPLMMKQLGHDPLALARMEADLQGMHTPPPGMGVHYPPGLMGPAALGLNGFQTGSGHYSPSLESRFASHVNVAAASAVPSLPGIQVITGDALGRRDFGLGATSIAMGGPAHIADPFSSGAIPRPASFQSLQAPYLQHPTLNGTQMPSHPISSSPLGPLAHHLPGTAHMAPHLQTAAPFAQSSHAYMAPTPALPFSHYGAQLGRATPPQAPGSLGGGFGLGSMPGPLLQQQLDRQQQQLQMQQQIKMQMQQHLRPPDQGTSSPQRGLSPTKRPLNSTDLSYHTTMQAEIMAGLLRPHGADTRGGSPDLPPPVALGPAALERVNIEPQTYASIKCLMCHDNMVDTQAKPCSHFFHKRCLTRLLQADGSCTCPLCLLPLQRVCEVVAQVSIAPSPYTGVAHLYSQASSMLGTGLPMHMMQSQDFSMGCFGGPPFKLQV